MKPRTVFSVIALAMMACLIGLACTPAPAADVAFGQGVQFGGEVAVGQWMPLGSTPPCTCPRCGHTWRLPYAVRAYDQFGNVTQRWAYQYAPVLPAPRCQWEYQRPNRQTFLRELPHIITPAK